MIPTSSNDFFRDTSNSDEDYFRNSSIVPEVNIEDYEGKCFKANSPIPVVPFSNPHVVYHKSDFKVLSLLGKGAYAKVVMARYNETKEIKAIKIVDRSFIEKENKLYQIYLEKEVLRRLNHPNVIKIDGIFEEGDRIYIVLEYLSGGDFYEFLKNNSTLNYDFSLRST